MASLCPSSLISSDPRGPLVSSLKPKNACLGDLNSICYMYRSNNSQKLCISTTNTRRLRAVKAAYSGDGKPSSASLFVGGFVLGGLIVGALGCVYAPQISKVLAGTDRKDLMRKLPKFIYDEEKALEKTRKVLAEKIAQLNSAIDDVSSQLGSGETPNGAAVNNDEVEATA